ncbi:3-ketoacyl-ACP reductase [Cognataquiflexum rubidum]|uniref:3-ketoacyl-ACP reductase n=1 Tax=Cognataquiflexum rubidum TaxID=2922273 RepID=UPI001F136024|nr:3-ketoacyl-ACP reductase [Cognataquiflexum rubidum]MCH6232410.1 3-ketoacyl-ACP reductase [Cognataquiflexum rubidum]
MKPVALITGGSRGIGLGIAIKLAENGYDLAINGVRKESEVKTVLEELTALGVNVHYIQGDISKASDREKIVNELKMVFGIVHVLVNNAGVAPRTRADVLEVSEADYDEMMGINLKGTFFLTQAIANWMVDIKKANPHSAVSIVNITSISAVMASVNRAAYCMSKAGLSMLSKVMAVRMAEFGIPVYEVRPGVIETDMTEKVKAVYHEKIKAGLTLEPRIGLPSDVGKAVAALVRGDIPYATGQVVTVDGGLMVERM